jgi:phenylalanyl-tRNA synthetase alpha chain
MNLFLLLPPEIVDAHHRFPDALAVCTNLDEIMRLKGLYVGRERSHVASLMELLKLVPKEQKRELGLAINTLKNQWEEGIKRRLRALEQTKKQIIDTTDSWDAGLPPPLPPLGSVHPLIRLIDQVIDVFRPLGYHIEEGPEIETEYYNFDGLNIPYDHPARGNADTFYFKNQERLLLRTHTSPVQVRVLNRMGVVGADGKSDLERAGGIRFLAPGRVYRKDEIDPTHSPMFHQIEGMLIGKRIGMHHLKGTLIYAIKALFGQNVKVRFRPSYFSFVEPGAEIDVQCPLCNGSGCRVCKNSGWVELLGAGMLHPNVLVMARIDPNIWSGFAFGMGVERIAMMVSQTPDLRLFFENDQRFLGAMGRLY